MSQLGHDPQAQPVYKNDYSLALNSRGVTISTNVFSVHMLQVKVNRRKYNSYLVIYITWLRQSYYVYTAQLKSAQLRCTAVSKKNGFTYKFTNIDC